MVHRRSRALRCIHGNRGAHRAVLIRGEPIPEGLYHIVVEVLAVHQDGSVLLTRRDYNKGGYPGLWESSAGG